MGIHQRIIENGFSSNVKVVNPLIDMDPKYVTNPHRNVVSWNPMIACYGSIEKAQDFVDKLRDANF